MSGDFKLTDGYYDSIAPSYNELYGLEQKEKLEAVASLLSRNNIKLSPDSKLLDVGCGTGIGQQFFEEKFMVDSFGIDPSEGLLKQDNYQCLLAGAEEMPFEDSEFDIVISITALQNFDDISLGLREIRRVGKELFVITFLKGSSRLSEMKKAIKENFSVIDSSEEGKDIIYILGLKG